MHTAWHGTGLFWQYSAAAPCVGGLLHGCVSLQWPLSRYGTLVGCCVVPCRAVPPCPLRRRSGMRARAILPVARRTSSSSSSTGGAGHAKFFLLADSPATAEASTCPTHPLVCPRHTCNATQQAVGRLVGRSLTARAKCAQRAAPNHFSAVVEATTGGAPPGSVSSNAPCAQQCRIHNCLCVHMSCMQPPSHAVRARVLHQPTTLPRPLPPVAPLSHALPHPPPPHTHTPPTGGRAALPWASRRHATTASSLNAHSLLPSARSCAAGDEGATLQST